jgi:5-methylcytosine-specific restriction endonuclease McrA
MKNVPYQIVALSEQLKEGQLSRRYRVRAILKWFGAKKRGENIVTEMKATLASYGLVTEPLLDAAKIDDPVRFALSSASDKLEGALSAEGPDQGSAVTNAGDDPLPAPGANEAIAGNLDVIAPLSEDQLEPENGDEEPLAKSDDRPVTSESRDWTISSLADKVNRGQLDLQPQFQREYVWDTRPELAPRLIESLLLEIPIPPIYFGKVAEGRWEIIDGQQRLTTLVNFVANKFPLRKLLRMNSLNDKFFKDLSKEQQEKILDAPIRSIVIDAAGNMDLRYEIFERLNRGSMALNEQELRNCVYRGPFNELLSVLERDSSWRKVKGGTVPEERFKEREMILRFFAFANRLPQYNGNLKRFLNEYMSQYAPREAADLKAHTTLFKQTMQNVYAVFGDKSARLYEVNQRTNKGAWDTKFSIATLDIQASALMNRPTAKVQQAAEQIRELFLLTMLTDIELQESISKHTGSTQLTKARWNKFKVMLDPIIDGTQLEPRFFSFEHRKELFDKTPICALCNNQIHLLEDSTVDHIYPYSKGGKTEPANGQLAHRGCNARKNTQIPGQAGAVVSSGI